MNRIRIIITTVVLFLALGAFAQEGIGIGNWRTHMPYQNVIDVELMGSKVYAATNYELYTYDKDDNYLHILNKINGLSDIGIVKISRNEALDLLLVAYTNTNIDLIDRQGNVFNMSDIKEKTILGNKTINNVAFKDEFAYVACGFGIVVFDLSRQEVKDTYYIGANGDAVNVTDVAFFNGRIYASTDEGLYYADANSNMLSNYTAWSFDNSLMQPHLNYNMIEAFQDKLLVNSSTGNFGEDTLYVFNGQRWDYFDKSMRTIVREIRAEGNKLLICTYYNLFAYDASLNAVDNIYACGDYLYPNAAALDAQGNYWIGDQRRGMIRATTPWNYEVIKPNGPYSKNVFELSSMGKHVWIATGGHAPNWSKMYSRDGVCHFDGQWWNNINRTTSTAIQEGNYTDFVCCATDPYDSTVTYVGTWGDGVLKFKDDELVAYYNHDNSPLDYWIADPSLINISGLAFDSHGNLWVANTGANNLLAALDRDGHWHSYNLGGTNSGIDLSVMVIDKNDYKWILRRAGNDDKIIVFNDNGTLDNTNDDQVKSLRCVTGQGGISGSAVNCLAVDRNGYVWVGTDSGPCYFSNTQRIFNDASNYDASVVNVPRNDGTDLVDPLFKDINVLSIAIDGNNNKWFGLESGVFEMSPDCKTQLLNFNTDNSPLLDNSVKTMTINDDGEVFFGTDQGLISYRGFATPGGSTNYDVVVYPNPVRPGYQGYVGIKGLVEDALVRITTVDGTFVTELIAEGGQAAWDCTTVNGQKVLPGIYLVFVSNQKGKERLATKILIMN